MSVFQGKCIRALKFSAFVLFSACTSENPDTDKRPAEYVVDQRASANPSSETIAVPGSYTLPNQGPISGAIEWMWNETAGSPLSTASIDVDTASYSRSRMSIKGGQIPEAPSIRPEDFLNYFPYSYAGPEGDAIIKVNQALVPSPWSKGAHVLALGLKAKDIAANEPLKNLVFLVDVSGSMSDENKLPLVKASLQTLTDSLRDEDRIALVTYAGETRVALPSTAGSEKKTILAAIAGLGAGGGTNGESGIRLAYDIAAQNFKADAVNRVVMATDGDFNVGLTDSKSLVEIIQEKAKVGIFMTILGFGFGSNDHLMENVAKDGNGNYFFIDNSREIEKVFGHDLKGNVVTLAKDVKIQLEFNPNWVKAYRMVGYINRQLNSEDFNDDKKDAGDLGSGQSVTYLFELVMRDGVEAFTSDYTAAEGIDPLIYQADGQLTEAAGREEIGTLKIRYKTPEGAESQKIDESISKALVASPSLDIQWQLAVAGAAMLLAKVPDLSLEWAILRDQLNAAVGDSDKLGLRREFVDLVDRIQTLETGL